MMPRLLLCLSITTFACSGAEDTDLDGDSEADSDSAGPVVDPGDVAFYSYDSATCGSSDTVVRGTTDTEDGHWSASRITPSQDMTINEVRIHLLHDPLDTVLDCEGNAPTQVRVWVTDDTTPPASAPPVQTLTVPAAEITDNERVLRLPTSIPVNAGDNVFVGIQMIATSTSATCVRTCADAARASDSFWSNADSTPFDWAAFSAIGLQTTQFMSIHGE